MAYVAGSVLWLKYGFDVIFYIMCNLISLYLSFVNINKKFEFLSLSYWCFIGINLYWCFIAIDLLVLYWVFDLGLLELKLDFKKRCS